MIERIELVFPALRGTGHQVTSPQDPRYNCIAWAAGDVTQPWWPDEADTPDSAYWPPGGPREETLESFRLAFGTLGYTVCNDDRLEAGYEKIALFALIGAPKHAARQLSNGRWTSKLGAWEDIEHALHDLTGMVYGSVVLILQRPRPAQDETVEAATHREGEEQKADTTLGKR